MNTTHLELESSVRVAMEVADVLSSEQIMEVFSQHASGEGEGRSIQRGLSTADMSQVLVIQSTHETECGVRIIVLSEFRCGTTTMVLEASAPD